MLTGCTGRDTLVVFEDRRARALIAVLSVRVDVTAAHGCCKTRARIGVLVAGERACVDARCQASDQPCACASCRHAAELLSLQACGDACVTFEIVAGTAGETCGSVRVIAAVCNST